MRNTVCIGLAIVLVAGAGKAFGQAAAEGALVHSMSTAAGASLGTALGRATGQLAGRTAEQIPRTVQKPGITRTTVARVKTAAPAKTPSLAPNTGASLIASIQGGESQAPACNQQAGSDRKPAGEAQQPPKTCPPTEPKPEAAHPAVITLPAAR